MQLEYNPTATATVTHHGHAHGQPQYSQPQQPQFQHRVCEFDRFYPRSGYATTTVPHSSYTGGGGSSASSAASVRAASVNHITTTTTKKQHSGLISGGGGNSSKPPRGLQPGQVSVGGGILEEGVASGISPLEARQILEKNEKFPGGLQPPDPDDPFLDSKLRHLLGLCTPCFSVCKGATSLCQRGSTCQYCHYCSQKRGRAVDKCRRKIRSCQIETITMEYWDSNQIPYWLDRQQGGRTKYGFSANPLEDMISSLKNITTQEEEEEEF